MPPYLRTIFSCYFVSVLISELNAERALGGKAEEIDDVIQNALVNSLKRLDVELKQKGVHRPGLSASVCFLNTRREVPQGAEEEGRTQKKRVLHTVNVGDSHAVLARGGQAMRLTTEQRPNVGNERKHVLDAGDHECCTVLTA